MNNIYKDIYKCFKCNNMSVWCYMPSTKEDLSYYCDNCVPRGCSCNIIDFAEGLDHYEYYKDELGRDLPCIEYEYCETGYDETISDE